MKKRTIVVVIAFLLLAAGCGAIWIKKEFRRNEQTPFERYGILNVEGGKLLDESGNEVQLRGVSTTHIGWAPEYVCEDTFRTLRDEWKINAVRIVMYTEAFETGYCDSDRKEEYKDIVEKGVKAAENLGLYVIIDWHTLTDGDPNIYADEAEEFFRDMTGRFRDCHHVIYEICNEPNGDGNWERIKEYAQRIIPVIRNEIPDSLILVGTPDYSQAVDEAADDPLAEFENIMYTLHFYAGSFKQPLRDKLLYALEKNLPVFISECNITEALLDGEIDYTEGDRWFELIDDYQLSYMAFSLCNSGETLALIREDCDKISNWEENDLSEVGNWFKKKFTETWERENK
ncbi:MAG: glycoside hydrolase family 5 protein [Eubacteriales bacterium]|nr:glycoside hydrolase family 5 protein [Eubacteriales bacterium]